MDRSKFEKPRDQEFARVEGMFRAMERASRKERTTQVAKGPVEPVPAWRQLQPIQFLISPVAVVTAVVVIALGIGLAIAWLMRPAIEPATVMAGPTAQAQPVLNGAYIVYLIPAEVAAWRATTFGDPTSACFIDGDLYISDVYTHNIVKITSKGKQSVFISGQDPDNPGSLAGFLKGERGIELSTGADGPVALACKDQSLFVAIALFGRPGLILKITVPDGNISIYAEDPLLSLPAERLTYRGPYSLAFWQEDLFATTESGIVRITPDGKVVPFISGLHEPAGLAFNKAGELFVAESTSDGRIIKVSLDKQMTTFAKDLYYPTSLAFSKEEDLLWVAESGVGKILRITPNGHKSVAFAGFSIAYEASFYMGFEGPITLAVNPTGELFVVDNTRTPYTTAIYRIYKDKERWKVDLFNEWQKTTQ